MLKAQEPQEGDDSSTKEYSGIKGQALTLQALTFIQNFISSVLDECKKDEAKDHTRTLRTMVQKACKTLSILSKYMEPPNCPEEYLQGPWLDKMRDACSTVSSPMFKEVVHVVLQHTVLTIHLKTTYRWKILQQLTPW